MKPEEDVQVMVAAMIEKAREEGRAGALAEAKTMLTIMLNRSQETLKGTSPGSLRQEMQGHINGISDALAWTLMAGNGGVLPEEFT